MIEIIIAPLRNLLLKHKYHIKAVMQNAFSWFKLVKSMHTWILS